MKKRLIALLFALSLLLTYLVEKPCAKLIKRALSRKNA